MSTVIVFNKNPYDKHNFFINIYRRKLEKRIERQR